MARIKWGMFVTDGRGKVGGHVLTKTRSGATVRTKVTPANPQTSYQGNVRGIFGSISRAWSALTEAQRLTWQNATEAFTKTNVFGDSYKPSGKNLFTALNSNLLNINEPQINVAPSVEEVAYIDFQTVSVSVATGQIAIDYSAVPLGGDFVLVLEASAPLSAGKYNFSGSYRKIGQWKSDEIPDDTAMFAMYVQKFGTPVVGKKIAFRIKAINYPSGQAGNYSSLDAIVGT